MRKHSEKAVLLLSKIGSGGWILGIGIGKPIMPFLIKLPWLRSREK